MAPAFFTIGFFLLVLQTTLFQLLPAWLGRPDLLFLLIIFVILYLEPWSGLVVVTALGLLTDIVTGNTLGDYSLSYLGLFLLMHWISRNLALRESVHQLPLTVVCYLVVSASTHLLGSVVGNGASTHWSWPLMLQNLVILAVVSLPFFHLCRRLHGLLLDSPPLLSLRFFRRRSPNRYRE